MTIAPQEPCPDCPHHAHNGRGCLVATVTGPANPTARGDHAGRTVTPCGCGHG